MHCGLVRWKRWTASWSFLALPYHQFFSFFDLLFPYFFLCSLFYTYAVPPLPFRFSPLLRIQSHVSSPFPFLHPSSSYYQLGPLCRGWCCHRRRRFLVVSFLYFMFFCQRRVHSPLVLSSSIPTSRGAWNVLRCNAAPVSADQPSLSLSVAHGPREHRIKKRKRKQHSTTRLSGHGGRYFCSRLFRSLVSNLRAPPVLISELWRPRNGQIVKDR